MNTLNRKIESVLLVILVFLKPRIKVGKISQVFGKQIYSDTKRIGAHYIFISDFSLLNLHILMNFVRFFFINQSSYTDKFCMDFTILRNLFEILSSQP